MAYILEVQRFINVQEPNDLLLGGVTEHVGYMNKIFRTKKQACDYYNEHNPHMPQFNGAKRFGGGLYLCSHYDPNTNLVYVVREHYHESLTIPPFDDN
jgi:hypothetical protein